MSRPLQAVSDQSLASAVSARTAAGVERVLVEVHPHPDLAPCDGPNQWPLDRLEELWAMLGAIDRTVKRVGFAEDTA